MSESEQPGGINDKIWITSHVRMNAERRLLKYNTLSLIFLTYYSAFVVVISIFSDYYKSKYALFDNFNLSSSVVVLVASLVVSGFRFEQTAAIFRECYLALDKLYGEDIPPDQKFERYHDILNRFPNHSDREYHNFLVNHILIEGKKVWNSGRPVEYTKPMLAAFLVRNVFFYLVLIALTISPVLFIAAPFLKIL